MKEMWDELEYLCAEVKKQSNDCRGGDCDKKIKEMSDELDKLHREVKELHKLISNTKNLMCKPVPGTKMSHYQFLEYCKKASKIVFEINQHIESQEMDTMWNLSSVSYK